MITRRHFIEMFGLTAVAGLSLTPIGKVFAQTAQTDELFLIPGESMSDPVYLFTSNHFKPFINSDFKSGRKARAEPIRCV